MKKDVIIAKNILLEKTCSTCQFGYPESEEPFCIKLNNIDGTYGYFPEENTCDEWKLRDNEVVY